MTEARRIAEQHYSAHHGEAWHGPAVQEIIAGVDAGTASARPIPDGNTIWEIVHHITAWNDAARRRAGGEPVRLTDEEDWPAVSDPSDAAWHSSVAELGRAAEALRRTIEDLSDEALESTVVGQEYSVYSLLHGVIQHDLYHAGQIALLKKLHVSSTEPNRELRDRALNPSDG